MIDKSVFSFTRYGVTLEPLKEGQAEMVRHWRNTPRIRELMLDTDIITEEQQRSWFQKVWNDPKQIYFLIYFKAQPIGVASLVNIDTDQATAEPGMYIYDGKYQGNILPFSAAFALNDIAFEVLKLTCLHGKIFESNKASLRFHSACGYQETGIVDTLRTLHLRQENYLPARQKLTRFMRF